MVTDSPTDTGLSLQRALGRLGALGVVPRAAPWLDKSLHEVAPRLRAAVLAEVPAFSTSRNPEVLPDLERHADEHIAELRRLMAGGPVGDFEFVRAHARARAAHRFPLEATLHAYRCGHKALAPWLAQAAMAASAPTTAARAGRQVRQGDPLGQGAEPIAPAIADFAMEYTSTIGIVAAAEYVAHTRVLAEAEGDRRTELLGILVSGYDEADARVARLLKRAGYLEQRLSFCVALAQSTDPLEMENPARALRIVQAMTEAVAALSVRALVGVRGNVVVAVYSDVRRTSGWTAPQARLADRIRAPLLTLGPAVLIGLSSDQPSTSFIPRGLHEATVALDFANVAERLVPFSELPIRRLLIHRGADYVQSALPVWFDALREADAKANGALLKTLRSLADADMNVQRAARELRVHANTLYARIERINDLTGLNAQRYHDLTHLLLAADCAPA
ncbi:MAG: helix-turn-helix domain-containing protein [Rubrivivax sp.]|nr:helix-turn-helix domain-containing protein [Rubrivivax sp.]